MHGFFCILQMFEKKVNKNKLKYLGKKKDVHISDFHIVNVEWPPNSVLFVVLFFCQYLTKHLTELDNIYVILFLVTGIRINVRYIV